MIQDFFPALLLCAVATFSQSSELKQDGEVRMKRNAIKSTDGSYDNAEFSVNSREFSTTFGSRMLAVQYFDAYFNGTVTFIVDGKTQHVESLIDTANDIGTFNAFIVHHNLTIRYHQDKQEDLIILHNEKLYGEINQTGCYPYEFAGSVSISQQWQMPDNTIYSDTYIPNGGTRGYPKNCSYTLRKPPSGTVWAIDVMGLALEDGETLSINGSLQNEPFRKFYEGSSSNPRVLKRFYSDAAVQIDYRRPNAINSDMPAFRILAAKVAVVENRCSLEYHKQTFKDLTGKFAYNQSRLIIPVQEKCTWFVEVPENKQLRLHFLRFWQGPLSGRSLKISEPVTQYSLDVPNAHDQTVILSNPDNATFTVSFDWETDGLHQWFGFDLNYFIEDVGTPSETKPITLPLTTSTPAATETTANLLPTTSSSLPCIFILERNILISALLALFVHCIMLL